MDHDDLRIGDAEREQTMADLREHFAQGRLTHEELDERLDRTLTAKTARDLAGVTADLPGRRSGRQPREQYAPHEPLPQFDMHDWRAAMHAHRRQMQSVHHAQRDMRRDMRRQWSGHPGRRHHGPGPGPILPFLFVGMVIALIAGGMGIFKVLLVLWLASLLFTLVHRRFHYRG
ncbi:DUF1707 domain-containing protein [Nonomuraea sp. NPDC050643]|uniref:DUF1707 SHOCT-like domain-containing protein n=1 Tax=Nonomuraea sp. NPDC050643 TaxID=3155660 RepID=UPI0033F0893E